MQLKTHKRLKERFLIGRNKTKCKNFEEILFFTDTYNTKTNNSFIFCQFEGSSVESEEFEESEESTG